MTEVADTTIRERKRTPSDVAQVMTVARYDVYKHLRSKRLYGILAIAAILIIVNLVLPPALGEDYSDDPADFASGFIGFMPTFIIIVATLFAGDAIVSEFQGRTGYLLFPNPVKRWSLYVGKVAAALGLGVVLVAVYYAIVAILTFVFTGGSTVLLVWSMLLAFIYMAATISLGFMISSFMKGSTGALILTFALLFLIMPMVSGILSLTELKPDFLLTFQADSTVYILDDPYPQDYSDTFDVGTGSPMTIWYYYPQPWTAAAVMLAYAVVSAVAGYLGFRKREMVS
ncbi:MAG: ABC transporter permease [Methanomassiliicoccales archaeon]|nr:MAG: ABC transporter permease [Methanomassiliicoccales archaeon]